MHELSICNAIAEVVLDHAKGRQVEAVHVRIGVLRQIVPASLTFCWSAVRRRPELAGSELHLEEVPGIVHCTSCDRRSALTAFSLRCPACGDGMVRVVQGEECLVTSIDLAAAERTEERTADVDGPGTAEPAVAVVAGAVAGAAVAPVPAPGRP